MICAGPGERRGRGGGSTAAMLAWLLTIPLGAALAIAPTARKTPTAPTAPGQQAAGLAPDAPFGRR